jgi:O-antigen ligase
MHIPDNPTLTVSDIRRSYLLLGAMIAIPVLAVYFRSIGLAIFFLTAFLFLLFNFKLTLYFFVFSLYIGYFFFSGWRIRLVDFAAVGVILSYLGKEALSGKLTVLKTPLDKAILLFMSVLAISLVNAVSLESGIKNLFRHIELFLVFYIIASGIQRSDVEKLLKFFLVITLLHSLYNLSQFIYMGGKIRAYGIAGVSFTDMAIGGLIVAYVFCLLQTDIQGKLKYGTSFFIILFSIIATQTRGALLSCFFSYIFVSYTVLKKAKKLNLNHVQGNFSRVAVLLILGIVIVLSFFQPLVEILSHKLYSLSQVPLEGPTESIQIRFLLWEIAIKSFLHNPVLGIGIGQFPNKALIFPELRFNPLFSLMARLDAHNVVLSYLAETGGVGFLCLLYFMFTFLKLGWQKYRGSLGKDDLTISASLFGVLFFVAISSFYAGAWFWSVHGMMFMFFLALTAGFRPNREGLGAQS